LPDPPPAKRVAVVTGASAGIGLYTALGLANAGLHVVMTGRDRARTENARRFVAERVAGAEPDTALADFASLADVRRLAAELLARHARIDVLINNAGLYSPNYRQSADGFELTFAVNHLAPFLLTNLLLDRLKDCAPSRVVIVASEAHRRRRLDFADLAHSGHRSGFDAYGRSKLCNILFARELARRLAGSGVVATCLHPGTVATELAQRGGVTELIWRLAKPFMISVEQGAENSIFLATVPDPTPFAGAYVVRKAVRAADPPARDDAAAQRLWDESARLVGL
jgi:NAD(P)-dependent dehydrogenase (short-subunit alcohol dehydrogenase family)